MLYSLPAVDKDAIILSHFPTRHQAFIFRACEYVPTETIARILNTNVENVECAMEEMGVPKYNPDSMWLKRGYITIIRRMWHILPYEQLLDLIGMDEQTLARLMRDEDFLGAKLQKKPRCEKVLWRELTDDEKRRTEKIREIMQNIDLSGKRPFEFEYDVPQMVFEGNEQFATRMIYAFSGLYTNAFDIDSEEFLPDSQLQAYQKLGINGIWTQGILSQLSEFPFEPSISHGYEERINRMRMLTERLDKYGIKLFLYLNEPRSMPMQFFERYPHLQGHAIKGGDACLCTSSEHVKNYLKDAVESICRSVPLIGGFFTITRSENMTNCYSHSNKQGTPCNCPRCKERSIGEVIAETIGCFSAGAHRVDPTIKVFAWSWGWGDAREDIIKHLSKEIILLSQSELDVPFVIGGIRGNVIDYSMSITGPGELARREWNLAKDCGLEIGAKVQINTTWEASTVPAIPVSPSVSEHIKRLHDEGVSHLLLSWTLGGYPCRNIAAAAQHFYEKCNTDLTEDSLYEAEKAFSEAFSEFPFDMGVLYSGPQNAGPSTLLFERPTGYYSTMTCFAYDDLRHWSGIYPTDIFQAQFEKLCQKWEKGLNMLREDDNSEGAVMAHAAYCLFRSSLNQIRFIRARDEGRFEDAALAAKDELCIAEKMLVLMNKNAAIGYEAANHYYFSKGQLAEKIVNCHYIIEAFSRS